MHAACVVAEFDSMSKAKVALEVLELNDFKSDAVSLVWRGHEDAIQQIDQDEQGHREPHEVEHSMELGAALGAFCTTYLSIATLMVPIMIAGPLAGLAAGAAAGGLLAETKKWGIHEHAVKRYEQRVADGSVLVIVTSTPLRLKEAEQLLKTTRPDTLEQYSRRQVNTSPSDEPKT